MWKYWTGSREIRKYWEMRWMQWGVRQRWLLCRGVTVKGGLTILQISGRSYKRGGGVIARGGLVWFPTSIYYNVLQKEYIHLFYPVNFAKFSITFIPHTEFLMNIWYHKVIENPCCIQHIETDRSIDKINL